MSRAADPPHLRPEVFTDLARGRRSGAEVLADVLGHVAARCPECRAALAEYPRRHLVERVSGRYERSIKQAVEAATERALDHVREREEALALMAELSPPRSLPQALAVVTATPRYHRWGVVTRLADSAEALLEDDPEGAFYWALLAVAAALAIEPESHPAGVVESLRAASRIPLARALARIREDVGDAEAELVHATEHYARSSRHPLLELELALAQGEILLAAGAWSALLDHLRQIEGRKELQGTWELGFRYLTLLALGLRERGELEGALSGFRALRAAASEAPFPMTPGETRQLALEVVEMLLRLERYEEAWEELTADRSRFGKEGPRAQAARRDWLEAVTLAGLGKSREASALFRAVREGLAKAGRGLAAARVTLDELALWLREASSPEARRLIASIPELYSIEAFPRWALPALLRLQRLAWRRQLTPEAVDEARYALAAGPSSDAEPAVSSERVN